MKCKSLFWETVLKAHPVGLPASNRGQTMRKVLFVSLALIVAAFVVPLFVATSGSAASYTLKVVTPATGAQVSTLGSAWWSKSVAASSWTSRTSVGQTSRIMVTSTTSLTESTRGRRG